ncbi:hypothetical protein LAZ67_20001643 [Cordylochernes scorpioides]|uniref:Reverse transcriptase domain-containing protein n=1 Tax=Cordylochernes scorpioides TaxID=51811 RepID=A0ABY6LL44_9ARAC|nr:hypothetical protein LAZ67_20001643 [Cordylochernes scorpioides]
MSFFVDLRKAFDTVPHSILWKKLYNLGISYQFISTIRTGMQRRSKTSNPNSKPWFDRECYLTKKNTKSHLKIYMKSKKETDRVNYISKKKFYAALIRDKKKNTTNHCMKIYQAILMTLKTFGKQ